jgi:flagellar hook-associated protein FlgK
MISLQNAYQANAHILGAVQSMFGDLLSMVGTTS